MTRWPLHPFLATVAYLVGAYGLTFIPATWVVRPLLVGLAAVAIMLIVARLAVRSWQAAGVIVGGVWLVMAGIGALLLVPLSVWVASRLSRRVSAVPLSSWTRGLNLIAAIWLLIALVGAVPLAIQPSPTAEPIVHVDPSRSTARPDIYLLLLDGYARSDTLASVGYDNEPFLSALEERGFQVARDATGMYDTTAEVLVSLVHGRDTKEVLDAPVGSLTGRRELRGLIHAAPLLDEMRQLGYEIITSAPTYSLVTLDSADVYLDDGQLNEFELSVLDDTALAGIVDAVAPNLLNRVHASRIRSNFQHVTEVAAADRNQPTFMLAHVMSPHAPFVFDENGHPPPPLACYPSSCRFGQTRDIGITDQEFWGLYSEQVDYLNGVVLDTVDELIDDPETIIVVFSDHGARRSAVSRQEWRRTLFAARMPGVDDPFKGAGHAPAILPILLNTYFGMDAPVLSQAADLGSD